MYFESKKKGGINSTKQPEAVIETADRNAAARRQVMYMMAFEKAKAGKTRGGNN